MFKGGRKSGANSSFRTSINNNGGRLSKNKEAANEYAANCKNPEEEEVVIDINLPKNSDKKHSTKVPKLPVNSKKQLDVVSGQMGIFSTGKSPKRASEFINKQSPGAYTRQGLNYTSERSNSPQIKHK